MSEAILDGTGGGYRARVDDSNRLSVNAITTSFQHLVAHTDSNGYQIIGNADLVDGIANIIHVENIDTDGLDLLPMRIRMQIINPASGSVLPDVNNYFSITLQETYTSGGSTATPVNTTAGSTKLSATTVHINGATLGGSAKEVERCYPVSNGGVDEWNTDGVLIVPPGNTMNIRYVGNQTSGTLYASILFVMNRIN